MDIITIYSFNIIIYIHNYIYIIIMNQEEERLAKELRVSHELRTLGLMVGGTIIVGMCILASTIIYII